MEKKKKKEKRSDFFKNSPPVKQNVASTRFPQQLWEDLPNHGNHEFTSVTYKI